MRNMTDVFFHCSDDEHVLIDKSGAAISDLVEACEHAERLARSYIMTANGEDWRNWVVHVTDDRGDEIFVLPFTTVLGKPH
jgi:hypothetical protein